MRLDDFLDKFNWIARLMGVLPFVASFLPYRKSHKGRKVGPYVVDGGMWEIHIDSTCGSDWTGAYTERFLNARHIHVYHPLRVTTDEFIMSVKRRQAAWAEYQLARAGAPFGKGHRWYDKRNAQWSANQEAVPMWGKTPDVPPPGGQDQKRQTEQPRPRRDRKPSRLRDWISDL